MWGHVFGEALMDILAAILNAGALLLMGVFPECRNLSLLGKLMQTFIVVAWAYLFIDNLLQFMQEYP